MSVQQLVALQLTSARTDTEPLARQPYRLFFPLGVLLAWVGTGQWLLFSLQLGGTWRAAFHSMVQVQGFLGCFIAGFLFTFIPRRTGTPPPARWQLWLVAACPVLLAVFAWLGLWAIAQSFWLVELLVLLQFAHSRARAGASRGPASLVWVPVALALGVGGAGVAAFPGLHAIGKAFVLEGVVTALVMGIGAMLVPIITRGEAPDPATDEPRWVHALFAVAFISSFFMAGRAPYLLRLAVVCMVLVRGARLWKTPKRPGLNGWLVWCAAWCLPLGYVVLAAWPEHRTAGLHVVFIGAFTLLALTVARHVVAAHGGRADLLASWGAPGAALGGLLALALAARLAMQLDPTRTLQWMTVASLAFIAATAAWLFAALPVLRGGSRA